MNYSNIISDFTWSYSRIGQFEMCPYGFLLNYIKKADKKPMFFSDYGSFMHKLIEQYLRGFLEKDELVNAYLSGFRRNVRGKAPNSKIFKSYFEQGYEYLSNIDFPYLSPVGVEQKVDFFVGDRPFTGIIDCVALDDGNLVILDNKSRALKPRSRRSKPTVSDKELDSYLRQLYLYSVPMEQFYHTYPVRLEINCFRTGQLISEPFQEKELEKTKEWALKSIDTITRNEDWSPKIDYWKCRYICDLSDDCCYFQMNRR